MQKGFLTRVRVATAVCILIALVIVARLYVLQILHGHTYAARADAQSTSPQTLLDRGTIYFTSKNGAQVAAATLQSSSSTVKRLYPGGTLAAQELGFVAYNADTELKGRYGLERYYEETLGRSGGDLYANFFVELFGSVRSAIHGGQERGDIVTTIEPTVQGELEKTLETYSAQWHPRFSGGIVMDPKTGEILAMAINPTFDLNSFNKVEDITVFGNQMVERVYEMGSIMKPLTVAAGIDSGAITEHTTYDDTGCIEVDKKKICNFDGKPRGVVPVQEVLSQSLNVGASFVAKEMGPSVMRNYFLDKYKFGSETGIDLPAEQHGLVANLQSKNKVEYYTAAFGQGIAITPVATVRALATLANGGNLVVPHLVRSIHYTSGVSRDVAWGEPEQVLKQETAATISRMLTKVVDESLANGTLKLEHYSIAAKTGTAQISNPAGGGYYPDKYLHSFFGYFPSFDAKFIVFLFAYEPVGAKYASQTWVPPFKELTKFLINYYQIPPDR